MSRLNTTTMSIREGGEEGRRGRGEGEEGERKGEG